MPDHKSTVSLQASQSGSFPTSLWGSAEAEGTGYGDLIKDL